MFNDDNLYTYRANLAGNYDGDSVTLDVDLGLKIWKLGEKARLAGVDTPELKGPNKKFGELVRDELEKLITERTADGWQLFAETELDRGGKYGRLLVTLHLVKDRSLRIMQAMNVNEWLVDQKFAIAYDGGSKSKMAEQHARNFEEITEKRSTRWMQV